MNEDPVPNVQIVNTYKDYVNVKIIFEDEAIPPIEQKMLQIAALDNNKDKAVSTVYNIKERKGNYKLRFSSRSVKKIQETPAETVILPVRVIIVAPF